MKKIILTCQELFFRKLLTSVRETSRLKILIALKNRKILDEEKTILEHAQEPKRALHFSAGFLTFLILFISSNVLAITSDMKDIYQPGETLIAKISGDILEPIPKENVELKRGHVPVAFEYDIKKIEGNYYLYAILPLIENNYSLIIKEISTTVDGALQKIDFSHNFSTSGGLIDYYIRPGLIITKEDFEIILILNEDFERTILIDFPEEKEITIKPGNNRLVFNIGNVDEGFRKINIGRYEVPVLIIGEESVANLSFGIKFFPQILEGTLLSNQSAAFTVRIINTGERELTDISLIYNPGLFLLSQDLFASLPVNEMIEFNLTINPGYEPIYEVIQAETQDFIFEFTVNVSYTENASEVRTPHLEQGYYCLELGGEICSADELCSNEALNTLDSANCCIGTCTLPTEESSSWLGYSIAGFLIVVLIFIIVKYYKGKKNPNAETARVTDLMKK